MATVPQLAELEPEDQSESLEEKPLAGNSNDPLDGDEESQQQLYSLYLKFKAEDRYARMVEVRECAHDRMYWRGMQYIWWSDRDKCFNTSTGSQTWLGTGGTDIDDMPHFEFVTNIYQAEGLDAIAIITSAPPSVRFFPKNPSDYRDIETAQGFDKLTKQIERWNPTKMLLQDEVYYLWTDGVIGLFTEYVDGEKPAEMPEESNTESGEEPASEGDTIQCAKCGWSAPASHFHPPIPCPECGNELTEDNVRPEMGENDSLASVLGGEVHAQPSGQGTGKQTITVVGGLELGRPQWAKEQADFHYMSYDKEVHYTKLRAKYPDKAKKIKPGASSGADDSFERNARLAVAEGANLLTQTGGALSVLCTWTRVWFRPESWTYFEDDAVRDKFAEKFPNGARVEFTGSTYLISAPESMDKCWVVRHMMPGDGQHRNGMGSSLVSVQDRFNTETNIKAETYEYCIPTTYRDSNIFDDEAQENQRSEPGANVTVNLKPGDDVRQKIMQTEPASISPDMAADLAEMRGPLAQQLTGLYPAAVGNPQGNPDTATGMAIQRDQAKGRAGIPYAVIKQAHADIMTLACKMYKDNASGQIILSNLSPSGEFEAETVDIMALDGDAQAYPEGDEAFPELWNEQRAIFMQIMDTPQGQTLMQEPDNAELAVKLIGIEDLVIPGADARQKQLREISEMKQGIPVEIDPDVDDNAAEAATCKRYLNNTDGQDLKRDQPEVYMAIKAHMMAHNQAVAQAKQSEPPPMKPVSVSANLKDVATLPPDAQVQMLAEFGIHVTVDDIVQGQMLQKALKAPPPQPVLPTGNRQPVPLQ